MDGGDDMKAYQVRLPANRSLEELFEEIASWSWDMIEGELASQKASGKIYSSFRDGVRTALTPNLRGFLLCGYSNACHDRLQTKVWPKDDSMNEMSQTDRIFQLFVHQELDDLLSELVRETYERVRPYLKRNSDQRVRKVLKLSIRWVLGEYLYSNLFCGKTEFCKYSVAHTEDREEVFRQNTGTS